MQIILDKRVNPENQRLYRVLNFGAKIGFFLHILFILLFAWLGVSYLAWVNVGSCLIYIAMFFINRRGFHEVSAAMGLIEVIIHAILAVQAIGWDSGFQFFILSILPFAYLNTHWKNIIKHTIAGLVYIAFISLFFAMRHLPPLYDVDSTILNIILSANIGGFFLVNSGLTFFYNQLTSNAEQRLMYVNQKLENLAARDDLTGLFNRREMRRLLENEVGICHQTGCTFVLLLGDIDGFKSINDNIGHLAGDHVLIELSRVMKQAIRKEDRLARWGGEEFLVLLPSTDLDGGLIVAEKLREKIATSRFQWEGSSVFVTMTFGISVYERGCYLDEILRQADHALIHGKSMGKNCVVVSPVDAT